SGITCIRPRAPRGETARGLNRLSTRTKAATKKGSRPLSAAAASISWAKGMGNTRRSTGFPKRAVNSNTASASHNIRPARERWDKGPHPPRGCHPGETLCFPERGDDQLGGCQVGGQRHVVDVAHPQQGRDV